ncbi:MAG: hypothetical protein IBX69_04860 [Anaerolineales bacterium]|nr:hypothetical protein [Anaerolineales bacterium]
MAASKRIDLQTTWLVMSRKLRTQLEFWLLLVDYDREARPLSNILYQVYLFVFMSLWGLAMLTLLADFGGQALAAIPLIPAETSALAVAAVAFTLFFLLELYAATQRSPLVFSEADAHLLCQTPLDRRIVAVIWFLRAWMFRALIIWPASIMMGYALLEAQFGGELDIVHLPLYLLAGLRMLVVAIPLHLGLHSLAWSLGTWRLHGNQDLPALRWSAHLFGVFMFASCVCTTLIPGASSQTWLWPLVLPLQAGLGTTPLPPGIAVSLSWAVLGIFSLWMLASRISLARAAQETSLQEALQAAKWTMAFGLEQEIKQRQRLGSGRKPSRLPLRPGLAALLWRNAVQSLRSFRLNQIFSWVWIYGLTLGVLLVQDWWVRTLLIVLWLYLLGNRAVIYVKADLKNWWLLRQLPFAFHQITLTNAFLPLIGIGLAASLALLMAFLMGIRIHPLLPWLLLPGIVGIALAAGLDLVIRAKAERLTAGSPPLTTFLTTLMAALALGIPGGLGWLALTYLHFPIWLGILIALAVSLGLDYALYLLVRKLFIQIQ